MAYAELYNAANDLLGEMCLEFERISFYSRNRVKYVYIDFLFNSRLKDIWDKYERFSCSALRKAILARAKNLQYFRVDLLKTSSQLANERPRFVMTKMHETVK